MRLCKLNIIFHLIVCGVIWLVSHTARAESYVFAAIAKNPYQQALGKSLQTIFQRLGHDLKVRALPSKRALLLANIGELDGEVGRVAQTSSLYPNLIQVPVAIGQFEAAAIGKKANERFENFEQFKPYKLGILRGVVWSEKKTVGYTRLIADDMAAMIRMLQADRFDYGLGDRNILAHIKKMTDAQFYILEPPIFHFDLFPFVNKKHQELIPLLQKTMQKMKETGELQKLVEDNFSLIIQNIIKP
ncbi:MAG: transporter substrate-binding domain-containing protein [Methylocystaceae bacterium]|nr:transporter substrate-binding domain-containing protein [Methylocystaceae bacterium]